MTLSEINRRVAELRAKRPKTHSIEVAEDWDNFIDGVESLSREFLEYVATLPIPLSSKAKAILVVHEDSPANPKGVTLPPETMKKKFIAYPGTVTAPDGDRHKIDFARLCELHGVDPREAIDGSDPIATEGLRDRSKLTPLHVSPSGNYGKGAR